MEINLLYIDDFAFLVPRNVHYFDGTHRRRVRLDSADPMGFSETTDNWADPLKATSDFYLLSILGIEFASDFYLNPFVSTFGPNLSRLIDCHQKDRCSSADTGQKYNYVITCYTHDPMIAILGKTGYDDMFDRMMRGSQNMMDDIPGLDDLLVLGLADLD